MVKLFLSIFLSIAIISGSNAQVKLEGSFPKDLVRKYTLLVKYKGVDDALMSTEVHVDKNYRFKEQLPVSKVGFYTLSIVTESADGNKSNYNFVVYLQPKKQVNIPFIAYDALGVKPHTENMKDINNKVFLELQNRNIDLLRFLYKNDMTSGLRKEYLQRFYTIVDSTLSKNKLPIQLSNYIQLMAFDDYNANMYRFGMDLKSMNNEESLTFYDQPKNPIPYFNNLEILSFYNGISNIVNYVDIQTGLKPYTRRKSIVKINEQVDYLKSIIHEDIIFDAVVERLLSSYISNYKAENKFASDLLVFTNVANKINEESKRESIIHSFKNLQYTLVGAEFPKVELVDLNNYKVSLEQFKDKFVLIDVWASWCVPCIQMIPYFNQLEHDYSNKNIAFVTISIDANSSKWKEKSKELGLSGNQFWDSNNSFAKQLNITGIPHYLLYGPDGRLIEYKVATPNSKQIRELLDKIAN